MKSEVLIASAARTPLGKFSGSLSSTSATDLGGIALAASVGRSGIAAEDIEYTIMGNMLSAGLGMTPARQAAIAAGIPESSSALTVNKACASGMQSVILAAQSIQLGEADVVAAGGMENMSQAPHLLLDSRTGQRLGDANLTDSMIHDGLWCPFENHHMGSSAEAINEKYDIGRRRQDEFAERSNVLASSSTAEGWFSDEITPVNVKGPRGDVTVVDTDEAPRADTTVEILAKLRPAFPPGETITAGNASKISDGAAATIVISDRKAGESGVNVLGRISGYAHAANDPGMLFDAPKLAVANLLKRTGETLEEFDMIEVNEAYAAQVLANGDALGWDEERVNTRGGAVALGHPIGASGARILVTLLHGLRRTAGRKGLAVICHGGGGAVAMSLEAA
ncbi:MAG: acetyl-CoA C-acyltransferase [SAR202 cluster bacterium]|nr:acetyl-CoA C-acyltransferase [SAR202 cluster bacterium]